MAEIQKKIKICPNGHPYDPSRFESCPICSNGGFAPTLDPFAPDSMSATVDPGQQNIGSFAQCLRIIPRKQKLLSRLRKQHP